jgi:putative hydroxymethylpyrimidine transport system substrate-binding protein
MVGSERGGVGMTRLATALVVALAVSGVLVACGDDDEGGRPGAPEPIDLVLDFYVNPDHAGIYMALDRGDFREAGVDVDPQVPSDPSAPIRQVAAGRADLAISYEPEVLLARNEGLPVIAVAALVPRPLTSLISLPEAAIEDPEDLDGKTIATAGISYQTAFLDAILERAGLAPDDAKQVDVGFNLLPAVLSGRADAMLGGFRNVEGVDLRLRGKDPRVAPVDELGVPTYDELVLVASSDRVEDDPEPIRRFIAALEGGTDAAVDDPAEATAAILDAGQGLEPRLTRAEVNETLPLLLPDEGDPFGYMDPDEWERFAGFMADEGLIEERINPDEVLTNDLLP